MRIQLGPSFYEDDAVILSRERTLVIPLLLAINVLPCSMTVEGSHNGPALVPPLYLEVLQLLHLSLAVQLALPGVSSNDNL